jgi:signal transduction histidine kinase
LIEDGVRAAIQGLAERCPVPVRVDVPDQRYPAPAESAAYFVVAEGLTNIAKYALAASASVTARDDGITLEIEIRDDGVGGADPRRGSGLQGLADRVSAIGGEIRVDSPRGNGTIISARIPCA